MFKYIAHPETGTPVHVKSHLGQNIINAYATKLEGGSDLVTIDDGDSCDSNNESHDVNKSKNGGGSHASRKSKVRESPLWRRSKPIFGWR